MKKKNTSTFIEHSEECYELWSHLVDVLELLIMDLCVERIRIKDLILPRKKVFPMRPIISVGDHLAECRSMALIQVPFPKISTYSSDSVSPV